MIGIGDMYRTSNKVLSCGIDGYKVEKKYIDVDKILKEKQIK
jgi:hypothetical protein